MSQLISLNTPIKLGNLQLKNRLVMSPMALNLAGEGGIPSARQIAHYVARVNGGVGLIISESNYVSRIGGGGPGRMGLHDDSTIHGHMQLTKAVHAADGLIFAQLHHGGAVVSAAATGRFAVSSSATPLMVAGEPFIGIIPRELKPHEIHDIVGDFANAAGRAQQANYDGVQILAGHGYLIHQFLSPRYNRRKDLYGGSEQNRARLLLEVITAVREAVGPGFPLSVRLTGQETSADGYRLEFVLWLVRQLEGLVDEISITGGNYEEREWIVAPMRVPEGYLAEQSALVKQVAGRTLISVVGRLHDPQLADQIVGEEKTDLVYLGRALIADPEWSRKAINGQWDQIRPCIACNKGCIGRLMKGLDVKCTVNPAFGQEKEKYVQRESDKRIFVVGGGPAGMQAAIAAAGRGYKVTLAEENAVLGGRALSASMPPARQAITKFLEYQKAELMRTGVEVITEMKVTVGMIESSDADEIIIATGAIPVKPPIPGSQLDHVCLAEDVLNSKVLTGKTVAVIGGGTVGLETAEFLAEKGMEVAVIEMTETVARDEEEITKKLLLIRLNELGVQIFANCSVECITNVGLSIQTKLGREFIMAETVVLAAGYTPGQNIGDHLDLSPRQIHLIGDSLQVSDLMKSIRDGYLVMGER